jgi:large subunit ribosomal protein L10
MSKPVKELIISDYRTRFAGLEGALLVEVRGVGANENNALRLGLLKKDIRLAVIKNTLARKAFAGTPLEALGPALEGPSALVYGAGSVVDVARELVQWAKKVQNLQLKAAVLDGALYSGADAVKVLSRLPTRAEALARVVQVFLSPAQRAVGAATGPGARLLGIVKEIESRLEKGQSITRKAS